MVFRVRRQHSELVSIPAVGRPGGISFEEHFADTASCNQVGDKD